MAKNNSQPNSKFKISEEGKDQSGENSGENNEVDLPDGVIEIIRRPTATKMNRERDNRIQWTTTASLVVSAMLLVSAMVNVYQSTRSSGFVFYAQDIRTGELSAPVAVKQADIPAGTQAGPPPMFTEAVIARIEKSSASRRNWLNSLQDPAVLAAEISQINLIQGDGAVPPSPEPMGGPPGAEPRVGQ